MSEKEIKRLAKQALEEKWYHIEESEDWCDSCAFCRHAAHWKSIKKSYNKCGVCLIGNLPICQAVPYCEDIGDASMVIEALEELANFGFLSEKTKQKLHTRDEWE